MLQRFSTVWPLLLLVPLTVLLFLAPQLNITLFLAGHHALAVLPAPLWRIASVFGDWPSVLMIVILLGLRFPDRLATLLFAALPIMLLAGGMKAGFAEPRPFLVLPPGSVTLLDVPPGNGSFPSGHAMASSYLVVVLLWLWPERPVLRWSIVGALLVMLSRIAIGVHWPIDLVAGALVGWGVATLWCDRLGWLRLSRLGVQRFAVLLAVLAAGYTASLVLQLHGHHEEVWLRLALAVAALVGVMRLARPAQQMA
ncbi:phosphatase PAP2 family protein [Crenobacter sp. SG2303]|uniref:Phosphatase PAP2 family protein n=1 Tax=Crenobacter oryzisoli TaxID=3056844 RepID=A0ABT7XHT7_9NEIS|nr:phosphatase PAP2 family protein [Crenobacter sp. SG2303]MDN0073360.1 phosphatase PAP2 family protein [Crenobacter sp. SG2303]